MKACVSVCQALHLFVGKLFTEFHPSQPNRFLQGGNAPLPRWSGLGDECGFAPLPPPHSAAFPLPKAGIPRAAAFLPPFSPPSPSNEDTGFHRLVHQDTYRGSRQLNGGTARCGGLLEGTIERIMGIAIANRYFRSFFLKKKRTTGAEGNGIEFQAESHQGPPCKVSKSLRTRSGEHFSLPHPQTLLLASQQPALSQAAPGVTCNSSISTASPVLMIGLIDTRNRPFARQKCIVLSEKAAWSLRAAPDANFCNVRPPPTIMSKFQIPNQANRRQGWSIASPTPPSSGHPAPGNSTPESRHPEDGIP